MPSEPTVFVVDDDPAMRDSLRWLIQSVGLAVETFPGPEDFLRQYDPERAGCLVLDVRMPGMSGLDLQDALATRHLSLPIIFITGYGEVPVAVRALQAGALDFIQKPFGDQVLLDRIHKALAVDRHARDTRSRAAAVAQRLARLSAREREVLDRLVAGQSNKMIAHELSLSERTVEVHRSRVMRKLEVSALAQLVRLVLLAGESNGGPKRE